MLRSVLLAPAATMDLNPNAPRGAPAAATTLSGAMALLVERHSAHLSELGNIPPSAVQQSVSRILLRIAVLFFAESADLIPQSTPPIPRLDKLRRQLHRTRGGGPFRCPNQHSDQYLGLHIATL